MTKNHDRIRRQARILARIRFPVDFSRRNYRMKKLMSAALATGLCFTAASRSVKKRGDTAAERWRGRGSQRYPAMSTDFFTDGYTRGVLCSVLLDHTFADCKENRHDVDVEI